MPKKSLYFLTLVFCALIACSKKKENIPPKYILSSDHNVQKLELEDHKFCISLDLNSGSTNKNFSNDLYWHCRLSMAKYKLNSTTSSRNSIIYNTAITDLVTKISQNLSEARESVFVKENKKIDARDHQKCLDMGYNFNMDDRIKTDQYLLCRKRLIDDAQLDPAYGVDEYLKYPNRSYNLTFILDTRLDIENQKYAEAQKNYPYCVKYFRDDVLFKECKTSQDNSKQCLSEVDAKKFKKESEQKTLCQKAAYVRFPDYYLKDVDQRRKDIERAKVNADLYNNNSFSALGLMQGDIELFEPDKVFEAQLDAAEKQKALEKNINSKRGLYSRAELTKLRQKYIIACQQNTESAIKEYTDNMIRQCEDIAKYEPKEKMF